MENEDLITALIIGGLLLAFGAYIGGTHIGKSDDNDEEYEISTKTDETEDDPQPDPEALDGLGRDCVVMAPWGQPIIVRFSPEQWEMVLTLVEITGETVEEVVCEIAGERYSSGGKGLIPPPPWFGQYLREMGFDDKADLFDQDDDYDDPYGNLF